MTDPRLVRDLDTAEQCRLTAYRDSQNLWTIGWGHLLDQKVDWAGYKITQEVADAWREHDIEGAGRFAANLPEWVWLGTDCRRNALIELCFNMGDRWLGFHKARSAIQRQDWQTVHDEMLSSLWAKEVHSTRANRLANYMLTGQYPVGV